MSFEFLAPVSDRVIAHTAIISEQSIGKSIRIHSSQEGMPDLEGVDVAILGVLENRYDVNYLGEKLSFDTVRRSFYDLFPGNWNLNIVDLGDVVSGNEVNDSYFVVQDVVAELLNRKIIPIILGGSQDLTYAQYRAYDSMDRMVNLVNVDCEFDLGDSSKPITNKSFVGKVIVEKPYNLFNYSNLGYQTYFNSQEEIDLVEKLYFDAYRLGEVISNINIVEPVMRDADIVSIDLGSLNSTCFDYKVSSPNGFDGREICAIARYAGISDKVSSFGIYEFKNFKQEETTSMLIAQMMWYFIEGVNYRSNEINIKKESSTLHYKVPINNEVLSFYKSQKTGRWWIEIPFIASGNNKLKRHTLLPCTYNDYENACNQQMPERWYKAKRKNEI